MDLGRKPGEAPSRMTDPDRPPGLQERLLANLIVRAILWPALYFGVGGLEPVRKPRPQPEKPPPAPGD